LRFDLLFAVAVGDGLGEAFFCFGELSGAGVGVDFFFRCLRLGVGDGSKTFLIFVPSDSSAGRAASMAPNKITRIRSHFITRCCSVRCPQRRIERAIRVGCAETAHATTRAPEESLCSGECRPRNFREENFRSANARGNRVTRVPSTMFQCRESRGIANR
jgi:hypothetical protein